MAEVDTIDIPSGRVVALEANDSSLLYNITNMEKAGDRLIIHSRGLLKAFDPKTGKYLGDVATRGGGPTEFNGISQIKAVGLCGGRERVEGFEGVARRFGKRQQQIQQHQAVVVDGFVIEIGFGHRGRLHGDEMAGTVGES